MTDNESSIPRREDDSQSFTKDYLDRAKAACDAGDAVLGMYLYMAAFEEAACGEGAPSEDALTGLKEAWALACTHKERSLAEYIFERLEPYLSAEEITICAEALHGLALDKLEEFGLSREDLEDMAHAITEDLLDGEEPIIHIERIAEDRIPRNSTALSAVSDTSDKKSKTKIILAGAANIAKNKPASSNEETLDYSNIAGYINAIGAMRDLGIGMRNDPDFKSLLDMLNSLHGLPKKPALDTILFRSPAREDVNSFMMATLGELNMPTVHMRMEESYQGLPLLCVSARAVDIPNNGSLHDIFQKGGVLVLEDLDFWASPVTDEGDDGNAFFMMQLTRGAREAVNLIRFAVESPDVYVIATCTDIDGIDSFFMELLEPMSLVDIDLPTAEERIQIWDYIAEKHPSIRGINRADLVRLSSNMSRIDIYAAAREAVEDAYKAGLMLRRYQPVTRENIFDKIAAYQPLESSEYAELEDEVIRDFRRDLGHIDDILD
ncbi:MULTISPECIES: ribonucleotide reductase subunit alpha [unclassified Adlercreutzia]|uniref:ribonucleotide reductase subunit alpha n=1 Tax=unclassified Adlercreutzia TaxID=2636013 RepID=UPI0013EC7EB0|nr:MULTISPECIES: ribonucleotide reductase subunit alpha [unclassified Adlercreutzia]